MSDPVNVHLATGQEHPQQTYGYAQPAYGQQQAYGHAQPTYSQQQAYGHAQPAHDQPVYAFNPEIERAHSNMSTARMPSFVSFLSGHLLLASGMWSWTNKLVGEAKILGAPMDVMADVKSTRLAAKICSIIQIAITATVLLFLILMVIIDATAATNS